jgi:glycosyltransferase involved in cell wall biosynthesis
MKKKILVFYPGPLIPTIMMSQKRAITQILALSKDHDVCVATICKDKTNEISSENAFKKFGLKFYPIQSVNWSDSVFRHKLKALYYYINYYITNRKVPYLKTSNKRIVNQLLQLLSKNKFDIVISHYWKGSKFLKHVKNNIYKIIDTHALVEEDIELNENGVFYSKKHNREYRYHKKCLKIQKSVFSHIDLLVLNSLKTNRIAKNNYSKTDCFYCPNGQNFTPKSLSDITQYNSNTILFYGSMSGAQNVRAFSMFYNNIWPKILKTNKDSELIILGNNPPEWIKKLNNFDNIEVTGFVEDIRPFIAKACCMVIPMDIAVGFRGRIIEVMAMGVPIIGNHNALDCIEIENGVNGFIDDDLDKLAKYAIDLQYNSDLRKKISKNSIEFVNRKYSIDATFGKLSKYLAKL